MNRAKKKVRVSISRLRYVGTPRIHYPRIGEEQSTYNTVVIEQMLQQFERHSLSPLLAAQESAKGFTATNPFDLDFSPENCVVGRFIRIHYTIAERNVRKSTLDAHVARAIKKRDGFLSRAEKNAIREDIHENLRFNTEPSFRTTPVVIDVETHAIYFHSMSESLIEQFQCDWRDTFKDIGWTVPSRVTFENIAKTLNPSINLNELLPTSFGKPIEFEHECNLPDEFLTWLTFRSRTELEYTVMGPLLMSSESTAGPAKVKLYNGDVFGGDCGEIRSAMRNGKKICQLNLNVYTPGEEYHTVATIDRAFGARSMCITLEQEDGFIRQMSAIERYFYCIREVFETFFALRVDAEKWEHETRCIKCAMDDAKVRNE